MDHNDCRSEPATPRTPTHCRTPRGHGRSRRLRKRGAPLDWSARNKLRPDVRRRHFEFVRQTYCPATNSFELTIGIGGYRFTNVSIQIIFSYEMGLPLQLRMAAGRCRSELKNSFEASSPSSARGFTLSGIPFGPTIS